MKNGLRLSIVAIGWLWPGFLAEAGAAGPGGAIRVEAFVPKATVLVGEPVILTVTQRASVPVYVVHEDDLALGNTHLRILVDRGVGLVPYRPKRIVASDHEPPSKEMLDDGVRVWEHVLVYDDILADWVFPRPGRYRLVVEYADGKEVVRSRPVTVEVATPVGEEALVLERLRPMPGYILAPEPPGGELHPALAAILRDHPRTVYLAKARLDDVESRLTKALYGGRGGGKPDLDGARPALEEALAELKDIAANGGAFAADAMLRCAGIEAALGNKFVAREIKERIVREFPGTSAARLAAEDLESQ